MTRVARPGPLALIMTSRGEITTASAILGSEMATLVTSREKVSNSPRPSSSVISRAWGWVVEGAVEGAVESAVESAVEGAVEGAVVCAKQPAATSAAHHSLAILIETIPGHAY